ncbi:hypothetical protein NDU88_007683 [Pleurodeles waltl]|uniref:Uncharacterized protein n=1 Tax=Pleurodeles waltl TaxID=8319 RepID=A0AAV7U0G7_PLEWA|nr:hypothetical protein NDU88_007683 [Pleurodeles waltl]
MMSRKQAEMLSMCSSYQEVMPRCTHLTQELPRPTQAEAPRSRQRPRLCRFQTLPVTCGEIQEAEEEGTSDVDEERARRSFLQLLESLRRSTQSLHLQQRVDLSSCNTSSVDSGDSDCGL